MTDEEIRPNDERVVCCIDVAAKKPCYATIWSYGEICVGCGCCSNDPMTRTQARIAYHKELLYNDKHFDNWFPDDPELYELQKKNVAANIEWNNAKLKELRAELRKLKRRKNME